jgi:hypothetical protein
MKIGPFMQITSTSARPGTRGFALLITIIFLAVVLMIFASIMYWVSGSAKITERNNQYNMSSGAAEAAVERAVAQMDRDFNYGSLTTATYYASLPVNQSNWPVAYNFSDPTGAATNAIYVYGSPPATNSTPLNSQFSGLYGFAWLWTVSAKATPVLGNAKAVYNVPATVSESLNFASIPIFQFAIFYNINLEIAPGQSMTIAGPVFSNQGIWAGASDTTFLSTVAAVNHVDTTLTDPFANNYTKDGGPTFSMAGQPSDNHDSIVMPIGTNNNPAAIQAIIKLPPPAFDWGTAAAFSTNGQIYLANAADLYITNTASGTNDSSPDGTNIFVYYQDGSTAFRTNLLTPDFYILKSPANLITNWVFTNLAPGGAIGSATNYAGNVRYAGYSFITNVLFYDWREGWNSGNAKAIQAVQIDISKLNNYINNAAASNSVAASGLAGICASHKSHPINSIYVYTAVPATSTSMPAVRLVNGKQLPSPFTVVTAFPLYVWGNYNSQDASGSALGLYGSLASTAHTYPAALMADSVTILSTNWNDAITNKMPTAGNTTVNAAMLEGIVQSDPTISGDYSGGVENFMRLLEDWSQNVAGGGNSTLTYNGSIVVMFPSQVATNHWRPTGNYYNAPTRHWSFDLNFTLGQNYLPPLTPETRALIRGQWTAK